jgi:hypothetical protein
MDRPVTEATAVQLLQSDVSVEEGSKSSEAIYHQVVTGPRETGTTH